MANIVEIVDFKAEELDVYARLTEAQLLNREEPKKGQFIAESPKVIHRALDAGCIPLSFLCEKSHINGEARDVIARCGDIPVIPRSLMSSPSSRATSSPVVCSVRCFAQHFPKRRRF